MQLLGVFYILNIVKKPFALFAKWSVAKRSKKSEGFNFHSLELLIKTYIYTLLKVNKYEALN